MQRNFELQSGFSLRQLLPNGMIRNGDSIRVRSCTSDARQCEPGDLFVAITGSERDGHDEVHEAIRRGAAAFVAERLLPIEFPICVVPDSREAYGQICHRLAGEPSTRMATIGVTGTNGKTTTCHLLAAIMRAAGNCAAHSTTLDRYDGLHHTRAERTTPAPAEFASWMARSESHGCSSAILEASSCGLAERRLSGVELDCAVLTNIRRDHIGFHGSTVNYRKAKARILDYLHPEGCVVVNADDPTIHSMLDRLEHPAISFGRRQAADVTATVVERFQGEQTFLLIAGNETVPVRTRMIGDHHVSNCLAAAAATLVLGIPLTTIARGLESIKRLPNRLDRVECGQEFGVFVDSADTPDRLAIALRAVRQVTPGRLICLFSGDSPGAKDQRPLLGRVAERSANLGIVTSCDMAKATDLAVVHDVLDGFERPARVHVIPSRLDAIRWALDEAEPGDSVLITGSPVPARGGQSAASIWSADFDLARDHLSSTHSSRARTAAIGFAI
jgi:UDP-N-acetylmuramoyl-L-alanyl-D-glutamate--2,6-diaminopimelate ligase